MQSIDPAGLGADKSYIPFELHTGSAFDAVARIDHEFGWLYTGRRGLGAIPWGEPGGLEPDATTKHRFYVTYSLAQQPWENKRNSAKSPWARLLDQICDAAAAGGANSHSDICERLESYFHTLFAPLGYTGNHSYWRGTTDKGLTIHTLTGGATEFDLSGLLGNVYLDSDVPSYSCMDINGLLAMSARALGVPLQLFAAGSVGTPKPGGAVRLPSRDTNNTDNWAFHMFCVLYRDLDEVKQAQADNVFASRHGRVFDALLRARPSATDPLQAPSAFWASPRSYVVAIDSDNPMAAENNFDKSPRGIVPILEFK